MNIRFDHLLIRILVLIAIIALIYLIDFIFRTSGKNRIAENQSKLIFIDNELNRNDYQKALIEIDRYLIQGKKGTFQVNLKTRKAICLINQGNLIEAKNILEELIETYPFVKLFQDYYGLCRKNDDYVEFAKIIIDSSQKLDSIYEDKPSLGDIFSSMKPIHYIQFIYYKCDYFII